MKRWLFCIAVILAVLSFPSKADGQAAVQNNTCYGTCALGAQVKHNDALVILSYYVLSPTQFTCIPHDTLGTTWANPQHGTVPNSGLGVDTYVGIAPSTGADTVVPKTSDSGTDPDARCLIQVIEINNIDTSSPIDSNSGIAGCICDGLNPSVTTTAANDFVIAWGFAANNTQGISAGWGYLAGSGLTRVGSNLGMSNSWYSVPSAIGTYAPVLSSNPGTNTFFAGMIALRTVPPAPPAATMNLFGTINYADGTGFNGTLELTTTKSTVINKCVSPVQIVPTASTIKIVNGEVSFTPVYATNCLQPTLPYLAKLRDPTGNVVFTDNWYLPQTSSGNVDVGQLIQTNYAAGVTVSLPYAIISTPAGSQVITQPPGTTMTINNLVVLNPINGAITTLAGTPTVCGGGQVATGINNNGNAICTSIGTGVVSFNGRSGAVVPANGDYSYSMISGTPTLLNQNLYNNSTPIGTPRPGIDFSSRFSLGDEGSPAATTVDLATVIAGNSFTNITGLTVDNWGRVTGVSTSGGGSNPCGVLNGISCEYNPLSGIIHQWGTTGDLGGGTLSVTFPVAFPSICNTVQATTLSSNDRITYVTSKSTSGFTVGNNGSSASAMWDAWGK